MPPKKPLAVSNVTRGRGDIMEPLGKALVWMAPPTSRLRIFKIKGCRFGASDHTFAVKSQGVAEGGFRPINHVTPINARASVKK